METGNGGHEAQPEPVARRVAAAFQPVKPLEHVLAFVVGNSGPIIDDRDHGAVVMASNLHSHATGFAAIFDSVVHEIGHGVEQQVPISGDKDASIHDRVETYTLVFGGCIEKLHHLARDLRQV